MGKLNGTNHKTDPHKIVDFMAIQSDKKLSIIIVDFFYSCCEIIQCQI